MEIGRWRSDEQKGLGKHICGNRSVTERLKRKAKVLSSLVHAVPADVVKMAKLQKRGSCC